MTDALRTLASRALNRFDKLEVVQFGLRGLILPFRVRHVYGPEQIHCTAEDLAVICVLRNGEPYIRSYLPHYRALGIRHFVFLDNGSTDRTLELLCSGSDITVLQSLAPYSKYENTMKRYLAARFATGRWCLCADIDELFAYPYSERITLESFLRYLDTFRFNAVLTQMLDMFPDTSLSSAENAAEEDLKARHRYYDIDAIEKKDYRFAAVPPRLKMYHGGIRRVVFGTNNGLTKVSLFRMDGRLQPFVYWHHTRHAHIADVSCVLLHYPFVGSFAAKVKDAVETGRYGALTTDEYKAYWRVLEVQPDVEFKRAVARQLTMVDDLIESEFIVVSESYKEWCASAAGQVRG